MLSIYTFSQFLTPFFYFFVRNPGTVSPSPMLSFSELRFLRSASLSLDVWGHTQPMVDYSLLHPQRLWPGVSSDKLWLVVITAVPKPPELLCLGWRLRTRLAQIRRSLCFFTCLMLSNNNSVPLNAL